MAHITRLHEDANVRPDHITGGTIRNPLAVQVTVSGHGDLGKAFEGLDGAIRGAAALGARNAAYQIRKLARWMAPYDTGELHDSGRVQMSDSGSDSVQYQEVLNRTSVDFADPFADEDDAQDNAPERVFKKGVKEYDVIFEAEHAWIVHERTDIAFKQDNPNAPPTPRERGAKFLEKAMNEVAPHYPDWVADEIEKVIGAFRSVKPMAPSAASMRPRLVKKSR